MSFLLLLASLVASSLTLSPSTSLAIPIDIQTLDGTYATSVFARTSNVVGEIRTTESITRTWTSQTPHGDSVELGQRPDPGELALRSTATALADRFNVSAATSAHSIHGGAFAAATATSQTFFSPLVDGSATFGLEFTAGNQYFFTGASVNLFDVTLNQNLWSYGWDYQNPPFDILNFGPLTFTFDTFLHSSHQYELSMHAQSDANQDSQDVTIALTGLRSVKVPEPSTLFLLGASLVGLAWWRRKQHAH